MDFFFRRQYMKRCVEVPVQSYTNNANDFVYSYQNNFIACALLWKLYDTKVLQCTKCTKWIVTYLQLVVHDCCHHRQPDGIFSR